MVYNKHNRRQREAGHTETPLGSLRKRAVCVVVGTVNYTVGTRNPPPGSINIGYLLISPRTLEDGRRPPEVAHARLTRASHKNTKQTARSWFGSYCPRHHAGFVVVRIEQVSTSRNRKR